MTYSSVICWQLRSNSIIKQVDSKTQDFSAERFDVCDKKSSAGRSIPNPEAFYRYIIYNKQVIINN